MKKMKKALSILLSIAMIFCLAPGMAFADEAAATTDDAVKAQFTDMPDNWSTTALVNAVKNGLLQGYDDNTIRPNGDLTRAEMAAVITRAFGAVEKASLNGVTDVAASAWYADVVAKALQMEVMSMDTKVRPNDNITRQEAFTIMARAFCLSSKDTAYKALDKFNDKSQVASWALASLDALAAAGYVNGDGKALHPTNNITRAEFATIFDNMAIAYIDKGDTVAASYDGNVILRGAVDLKDVKIKGDLILADGIGSNKISLTNMDITGRLVVRGGSTVTLTGKVGGDIVVWSDNTTVYAYKDVATFAEGIVTGTNSRIITERTSGGGGGSSSGDGDGGETEYTLYLEAEVSANGIDPIKQIHQRTSYKLSDTVDAVAKKVIVDAEGKIKEPIIKALNKAAEEMSFLANEVLIDAKTGQIAKVAQEMDLVANDSLVVNDIADKIVTEIKDDDGLKGIFEKEAGVGTEVKTEDVTKVIDIISGKSKDKIDLTDGVQAAVVMAMDKVITKANIADKTTAEIEKTLEDKGYGGLVSGQEVKDALKTYGEDIKTLAAKYKGGVVLSSAGGESAVKLVIYVDVMPQVIKKYNAAIAKLETVVDKDDAIYKTFKEKIDWKKFVTETNATDTTKFSNYAVNCGGKEYSAQNAADYYYSQLEGIVDATYNLVLKAKLLKDETALVDFFVERYNDNLKAFGGTVTVAGSEYEINDTVKAGMVTMVKKARAKGSLTVKEFLTGMNWPTTPAAGTNATSPNTSDRVIITFGASNIVSGNKYFESKYGEKVIKALRDRDAKGTFIIDLYEKITTN